MTRDSSRLDLLIIGGGINGAGIARDAAGRGLSVLLAERGDLAGATSSASSKLIHGGLRYLEYLEFRLVAEALAEREVLLGIAPHIIWPLEFVLPHEPHLRPAWMIRAGLMLYDRLGRQSLLHGGSRLLPRSRATRLAPDGYGAGLKPEFARGFVYSDGWVDDARLVVLNARSAQTRGARIEVRTELVAARREDGGWIAALRGPSGESWEVRARVIVNAAGPWVGEVLGERLGRPARGRVRLVRGSHIIVPRLHERRHAFLLQNPDRRIVFLIPYERAFTLIGTTDVPVDAPAGAGVVSAGEIDYLCAAASRYTARPVMPADVVSSYAGVRPLYDDGSDNPSAVTRDYHFGLDAAEGRAPVLSIYGGKITTYRRLAEHALEQLDPWFGQTRPWTHAEPLPGGDFASFDALLEDLVAAYPRLPALLLLRLARRHGTLARDLLGDARSESDLGRFFGGAQNPLYEREARWLIEHEWARSPEDVLFRRTKCGLHLDSAEREAFGQWWRGR